MLESVLLDNVFFRPVVSYFDVVTVAPWCCAHPPRPIATTDHHQQKPNQEEKRFFGARVSFRAPKSGACCTLWRHASCVILPSTYIHACLLYTDQQLIRQRGIGKETKKEA